MRKIHPFLLVAFFYLLSACTRGQAVTTPQPDLPLTLTPGISLATHIPEVPEVDTTPPTKEPLTETPTPTPAPPTVEPTYFNPPTETLTPTLDPSLILLRIVSPGPMSKVVSPIDFIAHIAPDYTGTTRIELIGENGVELYRKIFKTYSNIGYFTRVNEKIQFEIIGAAEIARLQISTIDSAGRLKAFNSVRLLLQTVGENQFTPAYAVQDRTLLRYPKRNDLISGGELSVTGDFLPANNQPLVLEIIDDQGHSLGSRLIQFTASDGKYQSFTTSIPYVVNKLVTVQLVIRQSDDRLDGLSYLFSLPLIIGP